MRVFFDTDILLDVLEHRPPHYADSAALWALVELRQLEGCVSAVSFNNLYYLLRRACGPAKTRKALGLIRDLFHVVTIDGSLVHRALDSDFRDFEDALQYFAAVVAQADCLVTRNVRDFRPAEIPVYQPADLLALCRARR